MTSGLSELDDDFVDYVRARQHRLLRAAYLVCGDEALAEEILETALGALFLRWEHVRDDNPDAFVRRVLYREALSRHPKGDDGATSRLDLVPELGKLTPKQRAVGVLLNYEERTEAEAAEVLGLSMGALRHQETPTHRDVLQDAAEPVAEQDFVDRARRGARTRRQRTRRVWLAVGAAAAAAVVALTALPRGAGEVTIPRPTPTPPSPVAGLPWDPSEFVVLGARAQVGPGPDQMRGLPPIDDLTRSQLALPEVLGFGPDTAIPDLSDLGNSGAPVRAVLLRHTGEGLRAVLVRPTLANPYVLVDSIDLVRNVDEGGNTSEPLEVRAIANDRRHVMFIQPRKVLVLDSVTGVVRTFDVPDSYLENGGWAGTSIIVWSETLRWRISPDTGEVRRLGRVGYPGRYRIQVQGPDRMRILSLTESGVSTRTRSGPSLLGGVWGETFTNSTTNVATGGFLSMDAAQEANQTRPERLFQGIFTIDVENMTDPRLLLAPGSEGLSVGCCEVLGWAFTDQALIRWNTTHLLMWQASTGALRKVATLPSFEEAPVLGTAAASVALAP